MEAPEAVDQDAHECGVVNCVDKPLHGDITTGEDTESSQNATQFTESTMTLLFTGKHFYCNCIDMSPYRKGNRATPTWLLFADNAGVYR